ncbi:hypothetical protein COCNU_04G015440 [Cocos nucifera]|uniref:ATP-dependent RNA helicase n=1 Tax=Cocos nucifera TaxID=13894 RepID=A0A8K0I8I6_COCNU|nr:hypothetical protein COCNU_04G015440 [Cocos nucifera]
MNRSSCNISEETAHEQVKLGGIPYYFDGLSIFTSQSNLRHVYGICEKLVHRFHWIVPGCIMGGENRTKEKARLRKGISILIATPGRLLDHLKHTQSFVYTNLRWIVFDEADRILELGFGKAVEEILDFLGSRENGSVRKEFKGGRTAKFSRQNILLSATLNEKVNQLANISLEDPVVIGLDDKNNSYVEPNPSISNFASLRSGMDGDLQHRGMVPSNLLDSYNLPSQLIQRYVKVSCGSRLVVLLSILKSLFEREISQKIVVFFSTCDAVDFHYSLINEFRWSPDLQAETNRKQPFVRCKVFRLHGNMEHDDRRKAFQGFSSEKSALLLCTDVAARGLDFPKSKTKKLARDAFCSWVRAYTAHRGELKGIFMVKKLHLGHVARSFGLKEQPSLVGRLHQVQAKKRKRNQMQGRSSKRQRGLSTKGALH